LYDPPFLLPGTINPSLGPKIFISMTIFYKS